MDASEEDQLAAAIAASLQDGNEECMLQQGNGTDANEEEDEEEEKQKEPEVPLGPEPAGWLTLF